MKRKRKQTQPDQVRNNMFDQAFNDSLFQCNSHVNHGEDVQTRALPKFAFIAPIMTHDMKLMNTSNYRRQSILRWKTKRANQRNKTPPKESDTLAATNGSSRHVSPFHESPIILTRTKDTQASTSTSNRPKTPRTKRKGRTPKTGRNLLQFIPLMSESLPRMKDCAHCGAAKFYSETKNFCCSNGRVVLANNKLPAILKQLLTSPSEEAKAFRTCIRTYNNLFAFTSLGVKSDTTLAKRNKGIYTFRVQGQVYHFINDLHPSDDGAKNLQLYFHDTEHEMQNRLASCERLSEPAIGICMEVLLQNPYACFFRTLKNVPHLENYQIILKTLPSQDQRVYNKPEVSQVAALWIDGGEDGDHGHRNIEVKTHNNHSRKIHYYYGCYDPLQYPLMFPFGELVLAQNDADYVFMREYYCYKLQIRKNDRSCLLQFGRLLQQYVVDNYVKLETQRLDFYRTQQQEIRKEYLQGVVDTVAAGETQGSKVGQRIILPSSFIGGPRNMRQKYIDAMTLVQKFGKPDIFLTMTCNPNWPEIKDLLIPQEESQNRADLVVRAFHARLELLKETSLRNIYSVK
uniref:uncharacterized protein LOC122590484 n=1 Tax=Erigeron canadensis TaxID=72917 RepID=UPI001CB8AE71|nr:uncharacterized protein LOC122590484 [Erigeron canadensis]